MLILTLRTDKPEAEIGLYEDDQNLEQIIWQADRELSKTIHKKIKEILSSHKYQLSDLRGIVAYEGPGSFTGLRIGLSVANALSFGLSIPIVAAGSEDWQKIGISELKKGLNQKLALPEYGALPHITKPRK